MVSKVSEERLSQSRALPRLVGHEYLLVGSRGAIGTPILRFLVARGHRVFAITRQPARTNDLLISSAIPIEADVLEQPAVDIALQATRPDAVKGLHASSASRPTQMTALPASDRQQRVGFGRSSRAGGVVRGPSRRRVARATGQEGAAVIGRGDHRVTAYGLGRRSTAESDRPHPAFNRHS